MPVTPTWNSARLTSASFSGRIMATISFMADGLGSGGLGKMADASFYNACTAFTVHG